jgi:hypothetical protein
MFLQGLILSAAGDALVHQVPNHHLHHELQRLGIITQLHYFISFNSKLDKDIMI